jgi:hypothetical protein
MGVVILRKAEDSFCRCPLLYSAFVVVFLVVIPEGDLLSVLDFAGVFSPNEISDSLPFPAIFFPFPPTLA